MKLFHIIAYIILFMILVSFCNGIKELPPSDKAAPFPGHDYKSFTSQNNQDTDSDKNYESSDSGSVSVNANFPDDYGKVEVKKFDIPSYNDFYLSNKTYYIDVRVIGIGRPLKNITIREQADPNLEMNITDGLVYTSDPFNDQTMHFINRTNPKSPSNILSEINDTYLFDDENNNLLIHIASLKPKNHLNYRYSVRSNRTGDYRTLTTVRVSGAYSKLNDIEVPYLVKIRQPEFEAETLPQDYYCFVGQPLNVSYHLLHKAGWSADPFCLNMTFDTLSASNDYDIYIDGKLYNGTPIPVYFIPFRDTSINLSIKYKFSGIYNLPELFIESQILPIKEKQIHIYNNILTKLSEDYQPFWPIVGILLALFTSIASILLSVWEIHIMEHHVGLLKSNNNQEIKFIHIYHNQNEEVDDEYRPPWWRW